MVDFPTSQHQHTFVLNTITFVYLLSLYCPKVRPKETSNFRPPPMLIGIQPFYYKFLMIRHLSMLTNLKNHPNSKFHQRLRRSKGAKINRGKFGKFSKYSITLFLGDELC